MDEKVAFVAMKFSGDSWSDKRYKVIREVLEEAGYEPIRADEIKTSGVGTEEVCKYLENAELVVIDSTGDSHNVSYELGYCHGIKRGYDKTILLRHQSEALIPFNYRHYRHLTYKDSRHLRRVLREFLDISLPMDDKEHAYTFSFTVLKSGLYGDIVAKAVIDALKKERFVPLAFLALYVVLAIFVVSNLF